MKTKLKLQFPQIKNVALKTACRLLICLLLAVFFSGCATTNTIKSVMTSDPPGADIYWGSSRNSLEYLEKTPMTRTYTGTNTCWSAWYYQFKKTGYDDSEIIFKEEGEELADRYVHGTLKALFRSVTYQNGETYTGEFKNDQRNGQGTYTWSDGQKYVGEFKYDKRNGQGTFTWPSGQKYVGEYLNDQYNGQGTLTLSDGR